MSLKNLLDCADLAFVIIQQLDYYDAIALRCVMPSKFHNVATIGQDGTTRSLPISLNAYFFQPDPQRIIFSFGETTIEFFFHVCPRNRFRLADATMVTINERFHVWNSIFCHDIILPKLGSVQRILRSELSPGDLYDHFRSAGVRVTRLHRSSESTLATTKIDYCGIRQ